MTFESLSKFEIKRLAAQVKRKYPELQDQDDAKVVAVAIARGEIPNSTLDVVLHADLSSVPALNHEVSYSSGHINQELISGYDRSSGFLGRWWKKLGQRQQTEIASLLSQEAQSLNALQRAQSEAEAMKILEPLKLWKAQVEYILYADSAKTRMLDGEAQRSAIKRNEKVNEEAALQNIRPEDLLIKNISRINNDEILRVERTRREVDHEFEKKSIDDRVAATIRLSTTGELTRAQMVNFMADYVRLRDAEQSLELKADYQFEIDRLRRTLREDRGPVRKEAAEPNPGGSSSPPVDGINNGTPGSAGQEQSSSKASRNVN